MFLPTSLGSVVPVNICNGEHIKGIRTVCPFEDDSHAPVELCIGLDVHSVDPLESYPNLLLLVFIIDVDDCRKEGRPRAVSL